MHGVFVPLVWLGFQASFPASTWQCSQDFAYRMIRVQEIQNIVRQLVERVLCTTLFKVQTARIQFISFVPYSIRPYYRPRPPRYSSMIQLHPHDGRRICFTISNESCQHALPSILRGMRSDFLLSTLCFRCIVHT